MSRDAEIRSGLLAAGVPPTIIGTTLAKEGAQSLRDKITNHELIRPTSATGVIVYPKKPSDASKSRRVFYLLGKELFLSGTTIHILPVSRLVDALTYVKDDDASERDASLIDRVRMVLVTDFYEDGTPSPFTAAQASRVRTWVRGRFEAGHAVSFYSDAPTTRMTSWWPQSFLGFIADHTVEHSV